MIKECLYCSIEYSPKRSDQKYCSTSCKNKASIARRNSREQNAIGLPGVNESKGIDQNQLKILLENIIQSNYLKPTTSGTDTLSGLLAEKDMSRDLTATLTEYRMKVMYLEDRVKDKEVEIKNKNREIERLNKLVTEYEKKRRHNKSGFLNVLSETCTTDPEAAEKMIGAMERSVTSFAGMFLGLKNRVGKTSLNKTASLGSTSNAKKSLEKKPAENNEVENVFTEEERKINKDSELKLASIMAKIEEMADSDVSKFNHIITKLNDGINNPLAISMLGVNDFKLEEEE